MGFDVHLVDGTYELFRSYFGAPEAKAPDGTEVGATRGFLRSMYRLVTAEGATHVACAFDTTVESFRNEMFDGYKTGEGLEPELWKQFPLVEDAAEALGLTAWRMVKFEADDGLAAGAHLYAKEPQVDRVVICTPDKDLMQCVRGKTVVSWDRRRETYYDEAGVIQKFGIPPASIPDYLALVGDTADGIPGIPRWGAKSATTLLARYGHFEDIPDDETTWDVKVRGAKSLGMSLRENREELALYKALATMRTDVPLKETAADLEWKGVNPEKLAALCERIGDQRFLSRAVGS